MGLGEAVREAVDRDHHHIAMELGEAMREAMREAMQLEVGVEVGRYPVCTVMEMMVG